MVDEKFWKGRRVFLTGHTGFKGSWLSLWLSSMGARVTGYALEPPTVPSLFDLCLNKEDVTSVIADVRDLESLSGALRAAAPEVVIHMAAQPLVRDSYQRPVDTYAINVMGTVNLLEAVRGCPGVRSVVNVTTDKCYENREWVWGYREGEPMGGHDPYSNSKACSELVSAAYRNSYFNERDYSSHGVALATARAGNVIGGGDWAADRLIPDCVSSLMNGEPILIRNPQAVRPWQHVLEPLSGYLTLAQKLYEGGTRYAGGWNFGPSLRDARPVEWVVQKLCSTWGASGVFEIDQGVHPHEAHYLKLDCSKAAAELDWHPRWDLERALESIVEWTRAFQAGEELRELSLRQIKAYCNSGVLK